MQLAILIDEEAETSSQPTDANVDLLFRMHIGTISARYTMEERAREHSTRGFPDFCRLLSWVKVTPP